MDRRPAWLARAGGAARSVGRRLAAMPRGVRLALTGLALLVGFAAVVLPLFTSGGAARAEVTGKLPDQVSAGRQVRADIAIDNTGDASIFPVCLSLAGTGARLISANFQGLDQVTARGNVACGGQLAAQQTISITIVFSLDRPGSRVVTLTPQQDQRALGTPLSATVTAS